MTGFEPAASCSQSRRATNCATPGYFVILSGWSYSPKFTCATNCATPGYSLFCHDTMASDKNKDFSVCGHLCGQRRFCAVFGNRRKTRYRPCCKALRRFALSCPGYRHGTPKPRVLSTELPQDVLHILRKIQTGALPGTATHLSYQISGLLARVKLSISRHCQHRRQRSQEQCQRQQVGAAAGTEPPADEGVVQRLRQ